MNKKIRDSFDGLQKKIKDIDNQNAKEHKIMEAKIKDIYNRLYDYNDRMDGIIVKTAPLDNLVMFKDNGNGTVDATKVMIQMLEEKITKKIERKVYEINLFVICVPSAVKELNNYRICVLSAAVLDIVFGHEFGWI